MKRSDDVLLAQTCGSPLTQDFGKYLDVPLIHNRINKSTCWEVMDKVNKLLTGWKSVTLSMAGKMTLIQAVSSAIPTHSMKTSKLPMTVCHELDRFTKNFLWGSTNSKKKVHIVSWEKVAWPKHLGRLGLT